MVDARPLVVVVCGAPLLGEAIGSALAWLADVRAYPAGRGATARFLESARPDGIVLDAEVEEAESYARTAGVPLVRVRLGDHKLDVLTADGWDVLDNPADSAEVIADVLAGAVVGRKAGH